MLISSDVNLHPALVQMRVTLFFDAAIAMLISSEVSFDLQLIFTLPPALRMLIISLVNFINNNFLNSYDVFKEESDAKEALNKHLNGEREYTYFVSAEKVKRTIKGNRVDVKKVLAFHVMSAKSDLPGSRIWVKIN